MSIIIGDDPSLVFFVFRAAMNLFWLAVCLSHSSVAAVIFASI